MDLKTALGRLKSQPKSSMHFFFCEQGKDGKPVLLIDTAPIKSAVWEPVLKEAKKKAKAEGQLMMPEEGHLQVVPKGSAPSSLALGLQIIARNASCMPKSITVGKPAQAPVQDKKVTDLLTKQKALLDKIKLAAKAGTPGAAAAFKAAMLAVSEAGALLRGSDADAEKAEALLVKAEELLRQAQATVLLEQRSGQGQKSIESSGDSTTTGLVDEDEGEDDEEEEDDEGPKSKSTGAGYDPKTGQYGGRPGKPKTLRDKDEAGDPLTAHHLYPWNKLRADLNDALKDASGSKMKKLLGFAEHTVDGSFWDELAIKDPSKRSQKFVEEVNKAAAAICWCPANIFMGPLNNKRGDDPGHGMDAIKMKSGLPTPSSAAAELVNKKGGLGKDNPLAERLAKNVRDAQRDDDGTVKPHRYDKQEWVDDGKGKRVQRGKTPIKEEGGRVDEKDDTGWTPAQKTTNAKEKTVKPTLSQEEIKRRREEAEKRKQEKAKVVPESQEDEDEGGGMNLFNEE